MDLFLGAAHTGLWLVWGAEGVGAVGPLEQVILVVLGMCSPCRLALASSLPCSSGAVPSASASCVKGLTISPRSSSSPEEAPQKQTCASSLPALTLDLLLPNTHRSPLTAT